MALRSLRGAQYRGGNRKAEWPNPETAGCYSCRFMKLADFHFDLPEELIAQRPLEARSASRLLYLAGDEMADREFLELPDLLRPNDLLVLNDTKVIPARVRGLKPTGGQVEILLERILEPRRILAQADSSKPLRPDAPIRFAEGVEAKLIGRRDGLFEFELTIDAMEFFQRFGQIPLPPYIGRGVEASDRERYQTVFAREPGAVAAPTAGLHFDADIFHRCAERGIRTAQLTLHVGAGTFQPVRVDDLDQHRMHAEFVQVSEATCEQIAETRRLGGRVVAVGTTVVRSLESAALDGRLKPFRGDTDIFIRPGYRFKVIDALITNFHLPQSTLLMLVCAFAGYDRVMAAYRHAVQAKYRFFSYGDAMFLDARDFKLER
jgi:S-adenosylmethionine:tRNA ribosyltransferase-isomerase